jgi:hypothetical protein
VESNLLAFFKYQGAEMRVTEVMLESLQLGLNIYNIATWIIDDGLSKTAFESKL